MDVSFDKSQTLLGVQTSVSPGSDLSFEKETQVKQETVLVQNNGNNPTMLDTCSLPPLMKDKMNGKLDGKFNSENKDKEPGLQSLNNTFTYYNTMNYQPYYPNNLDDGQRKDINSILNPTFSRRQTLLPNFGIEELLHNTNVQPSFIDKEIKKPNINNDDIEEIDKKNKPNNVIKKRKRTIKNNWNKMTEALFKEMLEYEKLHPDIKQCELQKVFNINRSTYWRWKKKNSTITSVKTKKISVNT